MNPRSRQARQRAEEKRTEGLEFTEQGSPSTSREREDKGSLIQGAGKHLDEQRKNRIYDLESKERYYKLMA